MRKRFEQQPFLDYIAIKDIDFDGARKSNRLEQLYRTLKEIFITQEYNEQLFEILENTITAGKKKTGREGMELWIIFILAQTRLCLDLDYDMLYHMANNDFLLRQLMGIETIFKDGPRKFQYQTIVDNVDLLDNEMLKEINDMIISFNEQIFKKNEMESSDSSENKQLCHPEQCPLPHRL